MNSFNVYGQTEQKVGGNTPVWLGTVKPMPRGEIVDVAELKVEGIFFIPAGTALSVANGIATPILSAGIVENATGYLYNDISFDKDITDLGATCAVVMHHPEGLLIERVYPEITEEQIAQLQANIPGVLLVRG